MALSKSRRFEIFKRDGFTCQYCGRRPDDGMTVLEVDHIHPRAEGGTDDELNLITACKECNAGKRAKLLTEVAPRPDADIATLALEQEAAEVRRYLDAKQRRDDLFADMADAFDALWHAQMGMERLPPDHVYQRWLNYATPEEIDQAIRVAGPKSQGGYIVGGLPGAIAYVTAIIKNTQAEAQ